MRYATSFLFLLLASCSIKQWYPMGGAIAGGAAGSLGGPVSAGAGAGLGYAAGVIAENGSSKFKDTAETLEALSEGDVQKLLELRMEDHKSGFEEFTANIWLILKIGACVVLFLFTMPILYTHNHKKRIEKELTRAPFPTRTTGKDK